jgi:hypothetical protein
MYYLESSFDVMGLLDLLQWIEGAKKTGRCSFRNGPAARTIYSRDGHIIACSANEPHLIAGVETESKNIAKSPEPEWLRILVQNAHSECRVCRPWHLKMHI